MPDNLYATDGRCHNAEPGTYGHECGKPATYIGTSFSGHRSGFCDDCRAHGYEAKGLVFHRIPTPANSNSPLPTKPPRVPLVEQTAQGPQLIIPGGERSAHQAAASRDAAGHGRIAPKKPQQEPGGLFAPRTAPQPRLFDE